MPAPLDALARLAVVVDADLSRPVAGSPGSPSLEFVLYDLLRHEHALAAGTQAPGGDEITRILALAQAAYGDLVGLLVGRPRDVLDDTRDGEWSLRDVLRHAIAVELRYAAQVEYSALRSDDQPIAIPADRLPCDRLSPPESTYAATRTGGIGEILELLGVARLRTDEQLAALPNDTLLRPSLWGTQPMTVRMRTHQIAVHLTQCAIQSEKCLAAQRTSEARRIVRQLCAARGTHERRSDPSARAELDARYRSSAAR